MATYTSLLKWKRPGTTEYPKVWHRFMARDLNSDEMIEYRIEDLRIENADAAYQHMRENFFKDEPIFQATSKLWIVLLCGDCKSLTGNGNIYASRIKIYCTTKFQKHCEYGEIKSCWSRLVKILLWWRIAKKKLAPRNFHPIKIESSKQKIVNKFWNLSNIYFLNFVARIFILNANVDLSIENWSHISSVDAV